MIRGFIEVNEMIEGGTRKVTINVNQISKFAESGSTFTLMHINNDMIQVEETYDIVQKLLDIATNR